MSRQFSSQAFNYSDANQTTVNPRTGMFNVYLPLVNLVGNAGLGPVFQVALSYNGFGSFNYGFGLGFHLGYSYYDTAYGILVLSSGEQYSVIETPQGIEVIQKKLTNFHFVRTENGYRIIWKNGIVEELGSPQKMDTFKVVLRIYNPFGLMLMFQWDIVDSNTMPKLTSIVDNDFGTLRIDYFNQSGLPEDRLTLITAWPGTQESISFALRFDDHNSLSEVLTLSENEILASSEFEYTNFLHYRLLTKMHADPDITYEITYEDSATVFPTSAYLPALPRVSKKVTSIGGKTPLITSNYTYSLSNFLGGHSPEQFWVHYRDYLLEHSQYLFDYQYYQHEEYTNGADTISIRYVFDVLHNDIEVIKTVTRDSKSYVTKKETVFNSNLTEPFDAQPSQYQLASTQKITYISPDKITRVETTETRYDEGGNLVWQQNPDGMIIENEYYQNNKEHPETLDPWGFVRYLYKQTIKPSSREFITEYTVTVHEYESFPSIDNAPAAWSIVPKKSHFYAHESVKSEEVLITSEELFYISSPLNNNPMHGRLERRVKTFIDGDHSYPATTQFTYFLSGVILVISRDDTGYDGLAYATASRTSSCTGRVLSEVDAQNSQHNYDYDLLGRLIRHTQNPGTAYQRISTLDYYIERNCDGNFGVTTTTDASGNKIRSWFDGLGRPVKKASNNIDRAESDEWFEIESKEYNAISQVLSNTLTDHFVPTPDEIEESVSITATMEYEPWGNVSVIRRSDGTHEEIQFDPIKLQATLKKYSSTDPNKKLGDIRIDFNIGMQPLKKSCISLDGSVYSETSSRYDGYGLLREYKDEKGYVTHYEYDAFHRQVMVGLPDKNATLRKYAVHTDKPCVTEVSVQDIQENVTILGTQAFDSLGRLKESVSGGRRYTYEYIGANPKPSVVTTPAGQSLEYQYIPELGNVVSLVADRSLYKVYSWNTLAGKIQASTSENVDYPVGRGRIMQRWFYSPSGQLGQEDFSSDINASIRFDWTLLGAEKKGSLSGDNPSFTYERSFWYSKQTGQQILGQNINSYTKTDYDDFGRVAELNHTDGYVDFYVNTKFSYDEFSREYKREIVMGADFQTNFKETKLTIEYFYERNGNILDKKITLDEKLVNHELYEYDECNRLIHMKSESQEFATDAYGQQFDEQNFSYDALNNMTRCHTHFFYGDDYAEFHYDNPDDPTQLTSVSHSAPVYPPLISLHYDANGRMDVDEAGRTLQYDILGRLVKAHSPEHSGNYDYDGMDRLAKEEIDHQPVSNIIYEHNTPQLKRDADANDTAWVAKWLKISRANGFFEDMAEMARDRLLNVVLTGRVSFDVTATFNTELHLYTPWGYRQTEDPALPGFKGELRDAITGAYPLGNGYRSYNPILMRFNSPDSLSPFGAGGINPYVYCNNDPINGIDLDGHLSRRLAFTVLFSVIGLVLAIPTFGYSLAAATAGVMALYGVAGLLELTSAATGIASAALEGSNPRTSAILGWVSLGTGLGGLGALGAAAAGAKLSVLAANRAALAAGGEMLGEDFIIFRGSQYSDRLIIDAHGAQPFFSGERIEVSDGTAVRFFGREGRFLNDPGLVGIMDSSYQSRNIVLPGAYVINYNLMQYPIEDSLEIEEQAYETLFHLSQRYNVDVVFPARGVIDYKFANLNSLFSELGKAGLRYQYIDGVFCRLNPWRYFWAAADDAIHF
ncbi:RHS repeat-associated core domain-containing protein [Sodalis sp. RH24]|uniref:RHS repeat-associated core domain-containing protein n=1 Tax=unclassified Sodalis (in: enterobacteria) TaxID=2636512 RepID=UPI0039B63B41